MTPPSATKLSWYALRVRSRCEQSVASAVRAKGFEDFLPLYDSLKRWSDRTKSVREPLFPGYIFCRLGANHRFPILTIPGALYFVGIGKTPVPVEDSEMEAIQGIVRSQLRIESRP
ncbi:MAG TPA: transcription termination/antitermination NusG family protein, partial [Nitrospiria bacterium]|nr:transcription termination/antitermination NusG family protein [Nitrospiria bacterium]